MAVGLRRLAVMLVVCAVALTSAYMGYQLATGQSIADIGRTIGVDEVTHKNRHHQPPACYGNPPPEHAAVQEKNKHCNR